MVNNWRWWYRVGYSESEPLILSVDNKIIGQAGVLTVNLKIGQNQVPANWFVDFAIIPEFQGKGFGKRSLLEQYREQQRGGKGVFTLKANEKTGKLISIMEVVDEDDLMIITDQGIMIRQSVDRLNTVSYTHLTLPTILLL